MNVLHRTTLQYQASVSPNSLSEQLSNYIQNPDMSAVAGYSYIYWILTGDVVTLMDQSTRDALDATILSDSKDSQAGNIDPILKALILALNDGTFVPNSNYTNSQIKNRIRSKL